MQKNSPLMESKQNKLNILMLPWLAHGHIFPYLELAKNLSNKNFNIFFCSTPINLTSIKLTLEKSPFPASIHLVELHLPSSPELPPQYHTTKNVPSHLKDKLFQAFQMSKSTFSDIICSLKPDILIYDAFQPWAAKHALSLNIPAIHFATSGATPYSFFHHHLTYGRDSPFPHEAIFLRDHERKALQAVVFPDFDKTDEDLVFGHFNLSCEIVLMRTCRAIEGKYIDYLSELCKKIIIPVGSNVKEDNEENDHSEIMEWLSTKKPFSTVFISFGSENYLSKDQMKEIAKGLEISNVNFIWIVTRDEIGNFSGEDVAKAINEVVLRKTGEEMRIKCAEVSEKMKNEEEDAINETAEEIRRICMEYTQKK
ncbi:hypothetical protein BUALT_Bualt14G0076300 [Buddleja alternifolia]|uniref:Glycosyltransferase N-terminal domain-containing protein n=1 Tax=Buddleja alternifolia TaxID=168488 RepID=A0AAV6WMC1_9LAMI|nr:hypothetical protein BUALT_Bualt14G0076300 [Buddleja alternifolia]